MANDSSRKGVAGEIIEDRPDSLMMKANNPGSE
jgi:hypothetical protein